MFTRKVENRQLGIYWGKESFSLAEAFNKTAEKFTRILFSAPIAGSEDQAVPDELKFITLLKNALQQGRISVKKANLTLSTKDFIFRSFVIPWMPAQEARSVIDFEATKYIPIPLTDLIATYQTLTFSENNQKQMRVLFFAARKDLLGRYGAAVEQAGLAIQHIEPEPISLARLLTRFGYLRKNDATAIITLNKGEGKIFIVSDELVQFVREFQMPEDFDDPALLRVKLFNEVRISFSFYTRQNSQGRIDQMLLLSSAPFPELDKDMNREFGKPTRLLTVKEFIKNAPNDSDLDLLSAFGNALWSPAANDFELAEKIRSIQKADQELKNKFKQYMNAAGILAGALVVCLLAIFISGKVQDHLRKRVAQLKAQAGAYETLQTSDLEKMDSDTRLKLNAYKAIRLKSNINFYLQKIPQILPDAAWLQSITVRYESQPNPDGSTTSSPVVFFDGYVYLPDANDEFQFVVSMVESLKKDPDFAKLFKDINLDSMNQQKMDNHTVINFKITCK